MCAIGVALVSAGSALGKSPFDSPLEASALPSP